MGWWKIDPNTGGPAEDGQSKLSQPPDFTLLNAVPGVDDEENATYLGDGPLDMASTLLDELDSVLGGRFQMSGDEFRTLFLGRTVPVGASRLGSEVAAKLLQIVDAFWDDIDGCYEDDWDRPALPAEKRWICNDAAQRYADNRG